MSDTFQCGDNPALVGYLYEECEPSERAAIAAHVAICAACAAELATLESTRVRLASWAPPDAELGFVITRLAADRRPEGLRLPAAGSLQAPGRWAAWFARPLPAWAQVSAAGAIFGAGLWLGIARGTATVPGPADPVAAAPAASSPTVSAAELSALERRLRGEIAAIRTRATEPTEPTEPALPEAPLSTVARRALSEVEGQLMARVRALIDESEQRQQRELAFRAAQIMRDVDSQRRVDLAQIQRNFGQIEGLTGAEVREQRQMLDYLIRVSQQGR